jgi:GT2 family glycosyltransferase
MPMKVSIIIINYNTAELTSNCIKSVMAYTKGIDYEIILVDNASTETDADAFTREFPTIQLVKSKVNGGFAYGNNLGIEKATGDYILLLNSDTILQKDSITKAVSCFTQHPDVGVVGCRMTFPDGKVQYSARKFRSISWELLDLFRFVPYLMSYSKRSALMLGKYFLHDEPVYCDWLNGAFFLFPKKIVQQLPGNKLDDRFFMYGEDQLWCEQIKKLGYRNLFYPGTTIIHINSGSTDLSKQLKLRNTMMKHELEIMKLRKGGGLYYFLFKLIYIFKEGGRNLIKSVVYKLSGRLIR